MRCPLHSNESESSRQAISDLPSPEYMRHMRLLMQVGTEVFTSGKILAL